MGCECCPYGSQCILVTAQVIMGIVFFLSIAGWYLTWVFGLIAWILVLLLACAKVHRAVLIVSGVFALIAAIGQFILAGLADNLNVYCDNTESTSYYSTFDDDYSYSYGTRRHYHYYRYTSGKSCHDTITTIRVLAIISGIGWVISAILVLYLSSALKDKDDRTQSAWARQGGEAPKVLEVPDGGAAVPAGTVTTETTQLPDGSTKIKETTVNADGSQTITEKIIAAPAAAAAPQPYVVNPVVEPVVTVQAVDIEKQKY